MQRQREPGTAMYNN